ncbi:MAG TPA: Tox-REase-5 domain-containing protein [Candidatus Cybelea sp.]|nr:Tox-REase-5 domain-containing protein [Candidatus Cybelea sp.]
MTQARPFAPHGHNVLSRGEVLVRHTPAALIHIGFGPPPEIIAERRPLARDYDPNQPRDDHGRWTGEGNGETTGGAGFVAPGAGAAAEVATEPKPLPRWPWLIAAEILLRPTNKFLHESGPVPGRPDLSYSVDEGVLNVWQKDDQGNLTPACQGRMDEDGAYRDEDGNVIAQRTDKGIVLNPAALPAPVPSTTTTSDYNAQSAGQPADDEPKLCPDKSKDRSNTNSARAIAYQHYITGVEPGLAYELTGIVDGKPKTMSFDGCRKTDGTMIEAKGPGYEKHMTSDDQFEYWFEGDKEIKDQMSQQSQIAAPRMVEWYFAEERVANYYRKYAEEKHLTNIVVIYKPPPKQPAQ